MPFRLVVVLVVLASCTNDGQHVERASTTTTASTEVTLVEAPTVVARADLNCNGPIQQLDAPPDEYEAIGDGVALETSTSTPTAFGTARTYFDNPSLRLATKVALWVRTNAVTELIVPDRWLGQLAFQWNMPEVTTHLVVGPCNGESNWIAFPGGYFVSQVGCFDFIVRTGGIDHEISVGLGAPCPGQTPTTGYTES